MRRVTSRHFDISGGGILRVGKHFLISKLSPYEDFGGGPGWKFLMVAFILHYFGKLTSRVMIRFEKQTVQIVNYIISHHAK